MYGQVNPGGLATRSKGPRDTVLYPEAADGLETSLDQAMEGERPTIRAEVNCEKVLCGFLWPDLEGKSLAQDR